MNGNNLTFRALRSRKLGGGGRSPMKWPRLVLPALLLAVGLLLAGLAVTPSPALAQTPALEVPQNLSATATSSCSVRLDWDAPSDTTGVDRYRAQMRPASSTNDADWENNQATTTATEAVINGLTPGVAYQARVRSEGNDYPTDSDDRSWFTPNADVTLPAAHNAGDWNGIVPPGLNPGDQYRILFVTCTDFPESDRSNAIADYNTLATTAKDGASGNTPSPA